MDEFKGLGSESSGTYEQACNESRYLAESTTQFKWYLATHDVLKNVFLQWPLPRGEI